MAFRILGFLDLWPHYSYLCAIFTLPLPLLSVESPLCVCSKYTYIHISVLIGTPRKTTTLRLGPKKKRGEGVGLVNEATNALLRLVSVQLPRHMSRRKEYLCFTLIYPVFISSLLVPQTTAIFSCALQLTGMSDMWTSRKGEREKRTTKRWDWTEERSRTWRNAYNEVMHSLASCPGTVAKKKKEKVTGDFQRGKEGNPPVLTLCSIFIAEQVSEFSLKPLWTRTVPKHIICPMKSPPPGRLLYCSVSQATASLQGF